MSRKQLIILCSVTFIVGLIVLMSAIGGGSGGGGGEFSNPDVEKPRVASGKRLYKKIMTGYPDLLPADFHSAKEAEGAEPNVMKLPGDEWDKIDQDQQVSLAQYLDSLGGKWRIQVGKLSSDGKRVKSIRSVITSEEWHRTFK